MSDAIRQNLDMRPPPLGVPVDPMTGWPLGPVTLERLKKLKEAKQAFQLVLHELDGTTEGSRPGDFRMSQAFTKLDECALWASAAVLNH